MRPNIFWSSIPHSVIVVDRGRRQLGILSSVSILDGLAVRLVKLRPPLLRIPIDERLIFPGSHIAQIPGHHHGFVVADQDDHSSPALGRFALKPHQMANDLEAVGSAIDDIA